MQFKCVFLVVCLLIPAAFSHAAPIPIASGGTVSSYPNPSTSFSGAFVTGLTVDFDQSAPIDGTSSEQTGSIMETVYRNADNTLNFYYQVTITSTTAVVNGVISNNPFEDALVANFAGVGTSVDYVSGTGSAPGRTDRSADGGTIDFGVSPGMGSTAYLEVVTNETNYNFMGTLSLYTEDFQSPATVIINGIYGPSATAPVPEPASMALLGTGLLGVAILKRRYAR